MPYILRMLSKRINWLSRYYVRGCSRFIYIWYSIHTNDTIQPFQLVCAYPLSTNIRSTFNFNYIDSQIILFDQLDYIIWFSAIMAVGGRRIEIASPVQYNSILYIYIYTHMHTRMSSPSIYQWQRPMKCVIKIV